MVLRRHEEFVWGWSRFQPDRGFEFNGTALQADNGTVLLVDPVPATDAERAALKGLGRRFEVVLLNAHHERDAARFAEAFAAPIKAPGADLPLLKTRLAKPFDDGDAFEGGWVARTLPNHKTPGESVLWNAQRGILLVGDALIADPVTGLRLPPPAMIADRFAALQALASLLELEFEMLLTGDGFVLPAGGREALRRFLVREGALAPQP